MKLLSQCVLVSFTIFALAMGWGVAGAQSQRPIVIEPAEQNVSAGYFDVKLRAAPSLALSEQELTSILANAHLHIASDSHLFPIEAAVNGQQAVTISGLAEGHYTVNLVAEGQALSDSATVVVQHHSMTLVWPLFTLGLVLFIALFVVLMRGYVADNRAPDS